MSSLCHISSPVSGVGKKENKERMFLKVFHVLRQYTYSMLFVRRRGESVISATIKKWIFGVKSFSSFQHQQTSHAVYRLLLAFFGLLPRCCFFASIGFEIIHYPMPRRRFSRAGGSCGGAWVTFEFATGPLFCSLYVWESPVSKQPFVRAG